jgi:LemA protein
VVAVIVIVVLVVLALLALVFLYNRFVRLRNRVDNAWAQIEVQLKRRHDLIPNLVETVKGYAAHERGVFEEVARTRSAAAAATGTPQQQAAAEGPFVAALRQLFAVAENYPDLKANQNFLALQQELANTEDRIQASRRFYNNNVQAYNARIKQFPSMFIARMGGFTEEQFFEVEPAIREAGAPRVDFGTAGVPATGATEPPPPTPPAGGEGSFSS